MFKERLGILKVGGEDEEIKQLKNKVKDFTQASFEM
jgi:hypothetical protein